MVGEGCKKNGIGIIREKKPSMKKFIARVCYCIANGTLTIVLESFVRDVCLCISIYMASVNITSTNETPHRFHLCNKSRKGQQNEQNKKEWNTNTRTNNLAV